MVGVPLVDREQFRHWGDQLAAFLESGVSPERGGEGLTGAVDLRDYLMDLLARRRRDPHDDLLGALIEAEEDGDRLSSEEIVNMVMLLTGAGHETTTSLLVNCVRLLLDEHRLGARLAVDPKFRRTAVEEVLRYEPPIQFNTRVLTDDVTIHGVAMPAGPGVGLVIAAAIRGLRVFSAPDSFDPERSPNPHLAFAQGIHTCLGASVARLEALVALEVITTDFPRLRTLAGGSVRKPSATFRGQVHEGREAGIAGQADGGGRRAPSAASGPS